MSFIRYLQGTKPKQNANEKLTNYDRYLKKKDSKLRLCDLDPAVNVTSPKSFSDVETLIRNLRKHEGIVVDLRDAPAGEGQRYLDFLSGATFALEGSVERLEKRMFLMTPKGVKIVANHKETKECKRKKLTRKS